MTLSDITPETRPPESKPAAMPDPAAFATGLVDLQTGLAGWMFRQQAETLRYLRRRQEKHVAFMEKLARSDDLTSLLASWNDYLRGSLADWLDQATRSASLNETARGAAPAPADGGTAERIGVLAGPVAPVPGAPLSAPDPDRAEAGQARPGKPKSTPL